MPASPSRPPTPDSDDAMDVQIDDAAPFLLPGPSSSRPPHPSLESRKRRNNQVSDIEMMADPSPKRARLGTRNNNTNAIESSTGLPALADDISPLLQGFGGALASLSSSLSSSVMNPPSSSVPLDARPSSVFAYSADATSPWPRPQSFPISRSNSSVKMSSRTGSRSGSEAGTPAPGTKSAPQHSFWFEDGDIILCAQDVYFRVHGSKLADRSSTFKRLRENGWRFPGADGGPEKLDGRPIVRLEGDAPKDWILVLEAIYESAFYLRPVVFDSLGSLLRISTKYDICGIRNWVIAQLRTTWPDPAHLHQMGPMAIPRAAEAIAWGRSFDVPSILPAAFYALSVQRWRSGADGGRAHTVLTPSDMRALIHGRESLQDVLVEWIADPLIVQPPAPPPTANLKKAFATNGLTTPNSTPRLDSIDSIKAVSQMQVTIVQEPPKPPEIPRFTFHTTEGCGLRLERLWRRRLRPDARRPWGTWLLRELHRMASLPLAVASCRSSPESSAVDKGSRLRVVDDKFDTRLSTIPDAFLPIGRATPSAVATAMAMSMSRPGQPRPREAPGEGKEPALGEAEMMDAALDGGSAQGLGLGSEDLEVEDGRLVCASCWAEHRRLVVWRMNWLKDEIPGMFGL